MDPRIKKKWFYGNRIDSGNEGRITRIATFIWVKADSYLVSIFLPKRMENNRVLENKRKFGYRGNH